MNYGRTMMAATQRFVPYLPLLVTGGETGDVMAIFNFEAVPPTLLPDPAVLPGRDATVSWRPDGKMVALSTTNAPGNRLYDVSSGDFVSITPYESSACFESEWSYDGVYYASSVSNNDR